MNLDLWNKINRPPPSALKKIQAGRLKGKSDINPLWRFQMMTEQFGVCGIGWKYTIDRCWTEPGDEGEMFAFVLSSLYIKQDGQWSDPIPGIGGHKLRMRETGGIHNNDEAYKMATTDALSVSMKALGMAAEVYLGNFDGSKYINEPAEPPPAPPKGKAAFGAGDKPPAPPKPAFSWTKATSAERKDYVFARIAEARAMPDPVQAINRLKEISAKLKGTEFTPADMDAVVQEIVKTETDLNAETSGN